MAHRPATPSRVRLLREIASGPMSSTFVAERDRGAEKDFVTIKVLRQRTRGDVDRLMKVRDGSRELAEGEAVHFPRGPDGAHGLANETDEPVRVLIASTLVSPEVAEYPDHKQITAQARTGSQTGHQLWLIHDLEPPAS